MTAPAPRKNAGERRRLALAAAKELFRTRGYAATSLEDVAEAAGLSLALLRRSFPNPAALLRDVLAEVRAATLERWARDTDGADPHARLHAIAEQLLDAVEQLPDEFRLLHQAALDEDEARGELRAFYQEGEEFLARIIAEGQRSGVFRRSLDPHIGAWELLRVGVAQVLLGPLGLPIQAHPRARARTIECMLRCLEKTDV